ncbi:ATP-binding protein [Streptomyces sp. NPDC059582]|uniref:ATP-binding protein n=1 Tax=Streptomyces sp. NPDC059582 TaxID=3346875 RepID=UPI0036C85380
MSHLRAPAARADRREGGGRHGRPVARTAPPLPETHIRSQLLRLAVLPPVAVALSACAAILVTVRTAGAEHGLTLWAVLTAALTVSVAGIVIAAVAADRAARSVNDRVGALRRSSARGEAELRAVVEALRRGENAPQRKPRGGPPADADDFELLAADLARAHDGAVTAVVQAAQLSSQTGSEQKLEVFVNLARRLQSLVHREISILDELENEIEDPDLLKGLFHVDHLATRIRRHAENLAVLGGAVSRRQWSNPVSMTEVLRSAIAEVEQYSRVKLVPPIDGELRGHAVADVIHLLAELVENATVFSAPHTQVLLRANLVTSGLAVEVEDRGLGMPVEEQGRMNALLADPDQVNVARLLADGRIGLFVVSQLARRHGIKVRLQSNIYGGVQAVLVVPQGLLGTMPGADGAVPQQQALTDGGTGPRPQAQPGGPSGPPPRSGAAPSGARHRQPRGGEQGSGAPAHGRGPAAGPGGGGSAPTRNGGGPAPTGNARGPAPARVPGSAAGPPAAVPGIGEPVRMAATGSTTLPGVGGSVPVSGSSGPVPVPVSRAGGPTTSTSATSATTSTPSTTPSGVGGRGPLPGGTGAAGTTDSAGPSAAAHGTGWTPPPNGSAQATTPPHGTASVPAPPNGGGTIPMPGHDGSLPTAVGGDAAPAADGAAAVSFGTGAGSGPTSFGNDAGPAVQPNGVTPAPLPVRGPRGERSTPASAVPGIRPDERRTVAENTAGGLPAPRNGAVRGTMGKPQLPRRRAQEHIAPQLRGGPAPRQDTEFVAGHDPGLMAAFQRGVGLAEAQQSLESAAPPGASLSDVALVPTPPPAAVPRSFLDTTAIAQAHPAHAPASPEAHGARDGRPAPAPDHHTTRHDGSAPAG